METWQEIIIACSSATITSLLIFGGRALSWHLKKQGLNELKKIELTAAEAFRSDLMEELKECRKSLQDAWIRLHEAERRSAELESKVASLQASNEMNEKKIIDLESELELYRTSRRP